MTGRKLVEWCLEDLPDPDTVEQETQDSLGRRVSAYISFGSSASNTNDLLSQHKMCVENASNTSIVNTRLRKVILCHAKAQNMDQSERIQ